MLKLMNSIEEEPAHFPSPIAESPTNIIDFEPLQDPQPSPQPTASPKPSSQVTTQSPKPSPQATTQSPKPFSPPPPPPSPTPPPTPPPPSPPPPSTPPPTPPYSQNPKTSWEHLAKFNKFTKSNCNTKLNNTKYVSLQKKCKAQKKYFPDLKCNLTKNQTRKNLAEQICTFMFTE